MNPTPGRTWQSELETAERVFAAGELSHAVEHLSEALALGPNEERVHARIEAMAATAPLLDKLPPDAPYVGVHLLRAFLLRRAGAFDDAVTRLAQVIQAFPNRRYETVLAAWLVALGAEKKKLSSDAALQVMATLVGVGESTIGLHRLEEGERALLWGYDALAEALLDVAPNDEVRWACAGIFRRLGRFDRALEVLAPGQGYFFSIQRGLTLRAAGRPKEALACFQEARKRPEASVSDGLEVVRTKFVDRDVDEARVLLATLQLPEGDEESKGLVALCSRLTPPDDGVAALDQLRRRSRAPELTTPGDATANLFHQHRDQLEPGKAVVKLSVSGWESPSNRLLVALFAKGTGEVKEASYEQHAPDFARQPLAQVVGAPANTWALRDGVVTQACEAPSAELRARVAAVAGVDDELHDVWARALAANETAPVSELVAAMVHPPTDAAWLARLPHALFRQQVAAACLLAARPWSEVQGTFVSLLFGPVDWTSSAAVLALGLRAARFPDGAHEGVALLCDAVRDLLPHSAEPRGLALYSTLSALPGVTQETRVALAEWGKVLRGGEDEAPPEEPAEADAPQEREPGAASPRATAPGTAASGGVPGWVWLVGTLAALGAILALAR